MGIEQDIQSSSWRNEQQKSAVNLIFTFNWLQEYMREFFEPFGITQQQFNILRILRGAGKPLSTLQIRERMLDRASDTSRIVDRMVKKGLVQKRVCPNDKRLVDITLTEQGTGLLIELDLKEADLSMPLLKLTEQEASVLNDFLDRIRT